MNHKSTSHAKVLLFLVSSLFLFFSITSTAMANDYKALQGVNQVKVVFDVSISSPKVSNLVFWAVKNVYEDANVKNLPQPPEVAVVFHGPAVKLISTDQKNFIDEDRKELANFAVTLDQMKKDGVKLEVCLYAAKVLGVDPATILPQVDRVGNGFISIAGYQQQGYSVITIN